MSIDESRVATSRPEFTPGRKKAVLAVLVFAQLALWLDNTVLNVALKTLADPGVGLGASPSELEWSISSYTLIFAALLFTGGVLADRYGRRTVFVAGLAVFGGASAWAAYSGSPTGLILARGLMGVGSALAVPATLAIINRLFDGKERAKAIAVWSGFSGLAVALGPLLGGALIEHFWWGSIFLINVPVSVVAIIAALAIVPNTRNVLPARFDPIGVLLSVVGLLLLVYGIIAGGQEADWTQPKVLATMAAGIVVLALFVVAERRVREPGFDVSLFARRQFAGSTLALALTFFGLSGFMFFTIFYLQGVRELSPLHSGWVLLPVALGLLVGAPLSARVVDKHPDSTRTVVVGALFAVAVSFAALAAMTEDTSLWWFELLLVVQGLGIGATVAPATELIMATLPKERSGGGAAVNNAMRQLGAVLGVAVLGSLLATAYRNHVTPVLASAGVPAGVRDDVAQSAEATRAAAAALNDPRLIDLANDSFLHAMRITTLTASGTALLGVVVLYVFLRPAKDDAVEVPTPVASQGG